MPERRALRVMGIDPFHGGSHREFLLSVVRRSCHHWTLVTGKPVHWKWRMRSAPVELAAAARRTMETDGPPDVVFCTDMLDLAQWRGLIQDPRITSVTTAIYFHESQWAYPLAPEARIDFHFGYTNLVSALAADACWFNSEYHQNEFLTESERFLARMPDARRSHDLPNLRKRCRVLPPGFETEGLGGGDRVNKHAPHLAIGWVSRWEHDKRPDRFLHLLNLLNHRSVDFNLVLLGPRPTKTPDVLREIRERYSSRIVYDGFVRSVSEYRSWLQKIDVIVSTADHEYFGIAVCESIWAGAAPVLPNCLSYPELAPRESLYDSLDDAADIVEHLNDAPTRAKRADAARRKIETLGRQMTVPNLDNAISLLVGKKESADGFPEPRS